jgi:hypothetical protein
MIRISKILHRASSEEQLTPLQDYALWAEIKQDV